MTGERTRAPTAITLAEVQQAVDEAVAKERERTASVADSLADKWAATALKYRTDGMRRAWFGIGRTYVERGAEHDARVVEAAVSGLRAVARVIRSGAVRGRG